MPRNLGVTGNDGGLHWTFTVTRLTVHCTRSLFALCPDVVIGELGDE